MPKHFLLIMLTGLLKNLVLESPEIGTLGLDSPKKIGFCLHIGQLTTCGIQAMQPKTKPKLLPNTKV